MTFPAPAINHQSQVIAVGGLAAWHETTDDGVLLAAVLHVQETEHGDTTAPMKLTTRSSIVSIRPMSR